MDKNMLRHLELFFYGFILVVLAAINTWQLAHEKYVGSFIFGFLAAITWSFTVKKVVLARFVDRIIYAFGAAIGGIVGLSLVKIMYSI